MSHACNAAMLPGLLLASAGVFALDPPDPQRQQALVYLLHQDCGSCHGMTLKGGLGPSLLPCALKGKSAEYLHQVIAHGRPKQAMPPWENILSPEEIDFLVDYLIGDGATGETCK